MSWSPHLFPPSIHRCNIVLLVIFKPWHCQNGINRRLLQKLFLTVSSTPSLLDRFTRWGKVLSCCFSQHCHTSREAQKTVCEKGQVRRANIRTINTHIWCRPQGYVERIAIRVARRDWQSQLWKCKIPCDNNSVTRCSIQYTWFAWSSITRRRCWVGKSTVVCILFSLHRLD